MSSGWRAQTSSAQQAPSKSSARRPGQPHPASQSPAGAPWRAACRCSPSSRCTCGSTNSWQYSRGVTRCKCSRAETTRAASAGRSRSRSQPGRRPARAAPQPASHWLSQEGEEDEPELAVVKRRPVPLEARGRQRGRRHDLGEHVEAGLPARDGGGRAQVGGAVAGDPGNDCDEAVRRGEERGERERGGARSRRRSPRRLRVAGSTGQRRHDSRAAQLAGCSCSPALTRCR